MHLGRVLGQSLLLLLLCTQRLCSAEVNGDIRLYRGNEDFSGIVQIYVDGSWTSVCGHGFTDDAVAVTCIQLGFERGYALPLGAYGEYLEMEPYPGQFQTCVTGKEMRLVDCEFDSVAKCTPHRLSYASVTCMKGNISPEPDITVRLNSNRPFPTSGYFSPVNVYMSEVWGHVCGQFWDDADAQVVCRQLGFSGGQATYSDHDLTVPYLVTEITCRGTETDWTQCLHNDSLCYDNKVAAVVCHQMTEPNSSFSLSLAGGKPHYGKVVVTVDNNSGLICNESYHGNTTVPWTSREASAVCRQLGYPAGGYILNGQYDSGEVTNVVLEGVTCLSEREESLLQCQLSGWGEVSTRCDDPDMGVDVYCYTGVRLAGSQLPETEVMHIGRVELYDSGSWYGICASSFTQEVAMVACRQFGFTVAEVMMPGSFGHSYITTKSVSTITCTGSEALISECSYTLDRCESYSYYHAAVLCKQTTTSDGFTFSISDNYYGAVRVEHHGVSGYVCRQGWDDLDAKVMCKVAGYTGGVELNISPYTRDEPVWASKFTCRGTETGLDGCGFETDMSSDWSCADDTVVAGVLCFHNEPPKSLVRLRDGISDNHGRAEVYNDVTGWATICESGWSNSDAAVFCRQAGFADGQTHPDAFRTQAEPDILVALSHVSCTGNETSIYECGSRGWLSTPSTCQSHTRDAGVYCYKHVKTTGTYYGGVQYHTGDQYGLVCADGFDMNAALVVCKQKNFLFGLPVCCSGFGPLNNMEFSMSNVICSGMEASLKDCSYTDVNPVCASGHYAGVVCTYYNPGLTKIVASPEIKISYYGHEGFVCSDGFTDADAKVVCRVNNFLHGKAFKTSGKGYESKIRWLRGLGCDGSETSVSQCGAQKWGQIGVCSWDSVAAAICSNETGDMEFDIRLVNGSDVSGRVEVKVKGVWGTVCGHDFTRTEAEVICRHLNYNAGIVMPVGHFGSGSGDIILSGIECIGNESSVAECIWSGYGNTRKPCDHSQDAAVSCFYNTRLVGSTTINYGRLEMYDKGTDTWLAVCDRNINIHNALVICRQMGYEAGIFQQGSPLGPTTTDISIVSINCSDTSECRFEKGSCRSQRYMALYCSTTTITNEDFQVRLPLSSFYGPVSVRRFGLWGHVCSQEFDDSDAIVVCVQLGYASGTAVKTFATSGYPIIQGAVRCTGSETLLEECTRASFTEAHGCYDTDTVAGVICYNLQGISYGSTELDHASGKMTTPIEIIANGKGLFVSQVRLTDEAAAVYCNALDYAGGEANYAGLGSYGVSDLTCDGTEESILQCTAVWDPEKTRKSGDLAGAICYTSVRLKGGDPKYYGVVYTSKGAKHGPVCASGFERREAGMACSSLGFQHGLVLCCAPFGDIADQPVMTNLQCTGSDTQLTDCRHDDPGSTSCSNAYAAVACFSQSKPKDYTLSFRSSDSDAYAGSLVLTYLDINGSICMDGWHDNDAHVACKELGFKTGVAYNSARSSQGPFWTSNVECEGSENKLADCQMTSFGEVTQCSNRNAHAGVICYDNKGVFARLYGSGEARYGRLELSISGVWQSLCNTHWDNEDAHVLCRMLDFRTGEVFQETFNNTLQGPVWDINFMCNGSEASLTRCLSSGWKSATSENCARHTNDAGAFCYTSVKLSTGVGRRTDQGGVLLYRDDRWYTVCSDGFTDQSAQAVCRELGFKDGQARCCSPYGDLQEYPRLQLHKVVCNGNETDVTDCLVEGDCAADEHYASVVCYGFLLGTTESVTQSPSEEDFNFLPIIIAIIVFVCLILVAVVVFILVRRHREKTKLNASKEPFDRSIISNHRDGSVHFENRLHDIGTPEVPRVQYEKTRNEDAAYISQLYTGNPNYGIASGVSREEDIEITVPETQSPPRNTLYVTTFRTPSVHLYDSIKNSDLEASSRPGQSQEVTQTDDSAPPIQLTSSLANKDEVSSPTEDKFAPHFMGN